MVSPSSPRQIFTGLSCGIGAGALWGLVFLVPALAGDFNPVLLTVGRYLCYGLIAAVLLAPQWRSLVLRLPGRQWRNLAWLALTGNTLYYILLCAAVQTGGIALTSLVVGFLPVAITLAGSRERGAVPLRKLAPSILLCIGAAVCIGWQAVAAPAAGSLARQLLGLLCAIGALASWAVYAIGNARCLASARDISAHEWSLLTGIVTGAQSLLLVPLALLLESAGHSALEWARLGAICAGLAIIASILASALWNRMSRLLPLTLVGQMILFETLFALLYAFLWEQRMPTGLELAAITLLVSSVLAGLAVHRAPRQAQPRLAVRTASEKSMGTTA